MKLGKIRGHGMLEGLQETIVSHFKFQLSPVVVGEIT